MDKYFNFTKLTITYLGGVFTYLIGGYNQTLNFLFFIIGADIISGFLNGLINGTLDPNKMLIGGIKKISILIVIAVSNMLDLTFKEVIPIREITILYYIIQEFTSFIINMSFIIELPDELTKYFENSREYKEKEERKNNE